MLTFINRESLTARKLSLCLSFILIISFFAVTFLTNLNSGSNPLEGFFMAMPLMCVYVILLLTNESLLGSSNPLSKQDEFFRDLLMMSYSYLLANLFFIMLHSTNSDVKGWWPLALYFSFFYGLTFAFIYALICTLFNSHQRYTNCFALFILVLFALSPFYPYYISFLSFEQVTTISVLITLLMLAHFFIALSHWGMKKIF